MQSHKKSYLSFATKILAVCIVITALVYYFGFSSPSSASAKKAGVNARELSDSAKAHAGPPEAVVNLTQSQLAAITINEIALRSFRIEAEAVGSVAYHERDAALNADLESGEAVSSQAKASKYVVANVSEKDSPFVHVGEPVDVTAAVYPDDHFEGKIVALGGNAWDSGGAPALDPTTHRITVRCGISDPMNKLYPGMLTNVVIQTQKPIESVGIPVSGVVRKGDGTMTAWITKDRQRFEERIVKVGLQQDGYDQILDGLNPGELVATDGAVFISNVLYAPPSD